MAVAAVTHACDGILEGDYLEPYVPPAAAAGARPARRTTSIRATSCWRRGRQTGIRAGDADRIAAATHGVRAGQTLTIYRETLGGQGPTSTSAARPCQRRAAELAGAHRLIARAVYLGDLVAIHRITQ
jgi:hypothetical protein